MREKYGNFSKISRGREKYQGNEKKVKLTTIVKTNLA